MKLSANKMFIQFINCRFLMTLKKKCLLNKGIQLHDINLINIRLSKATMTLFETENNQLNMI